MSATACFSRCVWLLFGLLCFHGHVLAAACSARVDNVAALKSDEPGAATSFYIPVNARGWRDVTLPDNWSEHWRDYNGVVWYRIQWRWLCDKNTDPLAFPVVTIPYISMAGTVILNKDVLWSDRHLSEPLSRSWNRPISLAIPVSALNDGMNFLWVRVVGLAAQSPGVGKISIGPSVEQQLRYQNLVWHQRTLFSINLIISLVIAFAFSFIWIYYPKTSVHGWYALQTWLWIAFSSNLLQTESGIFKSSLEMARLNAVFLGLFVCAASVFAWRFIGLYWRRWEFVMWTLCAAASLIMLSIPEAYLSIVLKLWAPVFSLLYVTNHIVFIRSAWQKNHEDFRKILFIYGVFIVIAINDNLLLAGIWNDNEDPIALTPYATILTTCYISYLLAKRVASNMKRVTKFSEEMNIAVARACNELSDRLADEHRKELALEKQKIRQHFSHDLHDGVGGELVRNIALFEQYKGPIDQQHVLSLLKHLRDDLRQILDSAENLHLKVSETPGAWLSPLKQRFANIFDELEIDHDWRMVAYWPRVPSSQQAIVLIRFIEEALTNVIKHSRANCVTIEVTSPDKDTLSISVIDDGVGFDAHQVMSEGYGIGLKSMRQRIESIGGEFILESGSGHTLVKADCRF